MISPNSWSTFARLNKNITKKWAFLSVIYLVTLHKKQLWLSDSQNPNNKVNPKLSIDRIDFGLDLVQNSQRSVSIK
ncbi:hypothetical protein BpHYR1_010650 [Brachionus plicatilis]|uniref:Uncharacterized protein n=1 Tax=Brachionus plicatilis TaxID=10195 RepID=A0A3M7PBR4_BRAPC|nr:hypothetical protein BpHYR1_010650 [Brachionus plicatilis]